MTMNFRSILESAFFEKCIVVKNQTTFIILEEGPRSKALLVSFSFTKMTCQNTEINKDIWLMQVQTKIDIWLYTTTHIHSS